MEMMRNSMIDIDGSNWYFRALEKIFWGGEAKEEWFAQMTLFPGTGQRSFNYSYAKSGGHVSYREKLFNTLYDEVPFFFFSHPHNLDTRDIRLRNFLHAKNPRGKNIVLHEEKRFRGGKIDIQIYIIFVGTVSLISD